MGLTLALPFEGTGKQGLLVERQVRPFVDSGKSFR